MTASSSKDRSPPTTAASHGSISVSGNVINSAIRVVTKGINRTEALPWMAVVLGGVGLIVFFVTAMNPREIMKQIFGVGQCYAFDPKTDRQVPAFGKRSCYPGKSVYFKWHDSFDYIGYWKQRDPAGDHGWNRPQDRPNRMIQAVGDEAGHIKWVEHELFALDPESGEQWSGSGMRWVTIDDSYPVNGVPSVVVRRMDFTAIPIGDGKNQCDLLERTRQLFEWAFPLDAAQKISRGEEVYILTRRLSLKCDVEVGYGMREGPDFQKSNLKIVAALAD
jgi:hypothetical protein